MSYDKVDTYVDTNVEAELLEIADKYEENIEKQQESITEIANRRQEMTVFRRLFVSLFPHLEEERRVRG